MSVSPTVRITLSPGDLIIITEALKNVNIPYSMIENVYELKQKLDKARQDIDKKVSEG